MQQPVQIIDLLNILEIDPGSLVSYRPESYDEAVKALDDLKGKAQEARKRLSKIYHPDKGGDSDRMKEINWAADMIKNAKVPRPRPRPRVVSFTVRFSSAADSSSTTNSYYTTSY
jgi:hypothetical protein